MNRRLFLVLSLVLLALANAANAQPFPSKPVTVIVPYPPGSMVDIIARAVAESLRQTMGQASILENRPGAASSIATALVARAPADGYTLLMASQAHTANPSLYSKLSWHPLKSFAPVIMVGVIPNVIVVHPSTPAKTLAEFIAYARERPGKLNYASGGAGSSIHLAVEMLRQMAGIDLAHIPYKGSPEALAALLAGEVAMSPLGMAAAKPRAQSGQLRALAITTPKRSPAMPDVPTVAESGFPDYDVSPWYGYLAPAGTPDAIVAKLNADIGAALRSPEVEKRLLNAGTELNPGSPEDLRKFIESDVERWAKVIKQAGIKLD